MFTDSLNENVERLQDLLRDLPPLSRARARAAASIVEKAVNSIRRDNHRDPAAALGLAFAVMLVAQRMVQAEQSGEEKPLIQLL